MAQFQNNLLPKDPVGLGKLGGDLKAMAEGSLKLVVERNKDWLLDQGISRIQKECASRFDYLKSTEKYKALLKAAEAPGGDLKPLAEYYVGQFQGLVRELPSRIAPFIARLGELQHLLTTANLKEAEALALQLQHASGARAEEILSQLRTFTHALLKNLELNWSGLDLRLGVRVVRREVGKASALLNQFVQSEAGKLSAIFVAIAKSEGYPEVIKLIGKVNSQINQLVDQYNGLYNELVASANLSELQGRASRIRDEIQIRLRNQAQSLLEDLLKQNLAEVFESASDRYQDALGFIKGDELKKVMEAIVAGQVTDIAKEIDRFTSEARELVRIATDAIDKLIPVTAADIGKLRDKLDGRGKQALKDYEDYASKVEAAFKEMERDVERDVAMRLHRALGEVPCVAGLDFQRIAGEIIELPGRDVEVKLRGAVRTVGYAFAAAVEDARKGGVWKVDMTEVEALVDRKRNLVREAGNEVKLKASSLVMPVQELADRVRANAERLGRETLDKLIPDFGGLKLEKLLGPLPIDPELAKKIEERVKTRHGFDRQSMSAFVESKVDDLALGRDLTLFAFGPFQCRLREAKLFAFLRVDVSAEGAHRRVEEGRLLADWEMVFLGEPVITFKKSALECVNGRVKMNLDPSRLEMSKVLKAISDLCSIYSGDDEGFVSGIEPRLPTSVKAFCRMNIELPPVGAGAFAITNLWMAGHFELEVSRDEFAIRCGFNLASRDKPFAIVIFILGGCGWFNLSTSYIVPFASNRSPQLAVTLDVGVGASAGLEINLGFVRGSVLVTFAANLYAVLKTGQPSQVSFAFVLTFNGHVSILGLVSVDLGISLAIRYQSGGGMTGEGRIKLKIKICWCFTLKVDRGFTYRFGKAGGDGHTALPDGSPNRLYARGQRREAVFWEQVLASIEEAEACVC